MSEYASRETTHAPQSAGTTSRVGPAPQTPGERATEIIARCFREVTGCARAVAAVRDADAANDVRAWHDAREHAVRDLTTAKRSLALARTRSHDAPSEALPQLAAAETLLGTTEAQLATFTEPPRGWRALPAEGDLRAVLDRPLDGPAGAAYDARERELKAVLDRLSPVESRLLSDRIRKAQPDDPIAAALARMVPERRRRIVAFLDDARRREAVRGVVPPTLEAPVTLKRTKLGEYLRVHVVDARTAIVGHLHDVPWPSPAPDVDFLEGGEHRFVTQFSGSFLPHLDRGEELPQLLHPSDLQADFDRLLPSGNQWNPIFGTAIAQAVEASAKSSLQRLGPRYRAVLVRRGHRPDADDLVASHPIDPMVAAAMVAPDVLPDEPPEGEAAPAVEAVPKVEARWLGHEHRELWNFVEATPTTASAEDVAAALWGDPRKSTMAFALRKYGAMFRVAPEHARRLIAQRYRGEVVGATDVDNAAQIEVLARSGLRSGDAPARELGDVAERAPTPVEIAAIESSIGKALDAIRAEVAPLGMKDGLLTAYTARLSRLAALWSADDATRRRWLPVLQFQHTQLLAIDEMVKPLAKRISALEAASPDRASLVETLRLYVEAASVSHLRDESLALVKTITERSHRDARRATDGAVREIQEGTQEAVNTPKGSVAGTEQAREQAEASRQGVLNGRAAAQSPQEQQQALLLAGEVALCSRMRGAENALDQLYASSVEVFGDPEKFHKVFPNVKNYTEVVGEVRAHLADVQRAWDAATTAGTPSGGDAELARLQGRAAGLKAARERFVLIAGDKSLSEFVQEGRKNIRDHRIIAALVSLGINLVLTMAGGMGAAKLGATVAGALVGEAAGLAATVAKFGIDVAVTVTVNSAVQLALSGGEGSIGWTVLENTLMEVFTRGLSGGLRRVEDAAVKEGRALAELPHLEAADRAALTAVDFAGGHLLVDSVGGMAAQWAANRLVKLVHSSGEAASESFAMTVLQQGAAIGLGRFFHGRMAKWKAHGEALAKTQLGELPEMRALYDEWNAFFAKAAEAERNLSPDPGLADQLTATHIALTERETALIAAHPELLARHAHVHETEPARSGSHVSAEHAVAAEHPAAAPSAAVARPTAEPPLRGAALAELVGGARYEDGVFAVTTDTGETHVQIRRTSGAAQLRGVGSKHVVLEVPRGLAGVELERAVVGKLTELRETESLRARGLASPSSSGLGEHGSGEALSPADRGKIAELRVLRERQSQARAESPEAQKLAKAAATLERELGLQGNDANAAKRRRVVEAQVEVQDDSGRRARARRELDGDRGHPGIELHSHFFGVVDANVFRERAASASGHPESRSWMPLLERIAGLNGAEFAHGAKDDGAPSRAVAGDAVLIARDSQNQVRELLRRSRANDVSASEAQQIRELAEEVAEDGCRTALAATEETDFNSAYAVRDELVKQTFGGEVRDGETKEQAKQRAYDDMIRETLLELARQKIAYSEQSTSLNKLKGVTSPERVQTILRELIREGKIADGAIDVRFLGMMHTSHFGTREESLPPVDRPANQDFDADVASTTRATRHPGTVGNDVGGPELWKFDAVGIERFKTLYEALLQQAASTGSPAVFRPHVGEGAVDTEAGKSFHTDKNRHISTNDQPSHYERARDNIDGLLDALEALGDKRQPAKVLIRLGHVTHATPEQARRMRDLGVIAEVNLGSNVATGSLSQTEGAHGPRSKVERLDDHSLPSLLYYDVSIAISTDGGGVMNTTLRKEYERANQLIEDVLAGRKSIRIDATDAAMGGDPRGKPVAGDPSQRELTFDELNSIERGKFLHAYEKLYADAHSYYRARPKPESAGAGSATSEAPFGGAHHLSIAKGKGLVPTQNARIYEGVRTDVDAAANEYRGDVTYKVLEVGLDEGVVMYKVSSNDERFSVVLRSWKQDGPAYRPMPDAKHPNDEVRHWYHEQLARIAPLNEGWAAAGVALVERAHRAYQIRQQARLAARERMQQKAEVSGLRDRDFDKYQDADGTSFEGLVADYIQSGLTREQALTEVIASAQRSSEEYNQKAAAAPKATP